MKNKLSGILILIIILFGCSKKNENNQAVITETAKNIDGIAITTGDTFTEWWNYKYQTLPEYKDNEYLKEYDLELLLKYYRILSIEYFNTKGRDRSNTVELNLAEKLDMNYQFFMELNSYIGLEYYKYLGEITKEYFSDNDYGIIPDYYSPIWSTAYLGNHTFNCSLEIPGCKGDKDIYEKINSKIEYLKQNLPELIDGFRILSIKCKCDSIGTSEKLGMGYIWIRKDNKLIEMEEDYGTYSKALPEDTIHWSQDSWNDGEELKNTYDVY